MKKLIIISLIAGGIYLAASTKLKSNSIALQSIKAKIKNIKNVTIANGKINLKIDLNLTNFSNEDLGIDTFGLLSIRKLRFFNAKNRKLIGEAKVNINNITLPSQKTLVLADIIAEIPTSNLLQHLSLFNGNASETVKVVPTFNAAGKEFEINPENFV